MRKATGPLQCLLAAVLGLCLASPSMAQNCADLLNLKLPDTTIRSATAIAAGQFAATERLTLPDMPAFCRVVASVKAAPDSDIAVEIWLPQDRWAGVFHGNGNGGFGGSLTSGYSGMEAGLRRGYASATTDTGTAPSNALNGDPLIGHPQKWKDWGLLSTHVMTVTGKAIASAFYGQSPKRSYYTGCSTGGQQGLIEAEYYPEDYNGVLVGAPVINRTMGHAVAVWDYKSANLDPGGKLSQEKLTLLNKAAVAECGGKSNGLSTDPFIADPMACKFDPGTLACRNGESAACLTPAEVRTAKDFYSGPLNHAGHALYYGWLPGSEVPGRAGWSATETTANGEPAFSSLFKWVFGAQWDWRQFDFDRDMPRVDAELGPSVNGVMHGDLSRFRALGGKLIIYHGWADTLVVPGQTLDYYDSLNKSAGGAAKVQEFARLFFAPGVMHCGGGPGPSAFNSANAGTRIPATSRPQGDLFAAITHWVEDGAPPVQVIATKYIDDTPAKGIAMQRPLCAWPQKAWYRGTGSTNDAATFRCSIDKPK